MVTSFLLFAIINNENHYVNNYNKAKIRPRLFGCHFYSDPDEIYLRSDALAAGTKFFGPRERPAFESEMLGFARLCRIEFISLIKEKKKLN